MGRTLAIHWIATTHGTWLHGDPRGSWRHGKLIGPDPFLEEAIRARMTHDAVVLDPAELIHLSVVTGMIVRECNHRVFAATIRPAHAHIVFAPLRENVKTVIARLKRRSAEALLDVRRKKGDNRQHLWTAGQFPVFVYTEEHLHNAVEYVRDHNRRAGLPADPYPWIAR